MTNNTREDGKMTTFRKWRFSILIGSGIIAAGVLLYFSNGRVSSDKTQGAIGKRDVYRDSQVNTADIAAPGQAPVATTAILESTDFKALAKNPAFQELVRDSNFAELKQDSRFTDLLADSQFQALMQNPAFMELMRFSGANLKEESQVQGIMFKAVHENARFEALRNNANFNQIMHNNAFLGLVRESYFRGMMASAHFNELARTQLFNNLVMNASFRQNLLSLSSSQLLMGSGGIYVPPGATRGTKIAQP